LSGGMRQRAALLRTLLFDTDVILLDEPFGALDAQTKSHMQEWLMQLWADFGKTVVFVTHDVDEAVKLGDRIAVLGNRSTILQYDTPEAILANPADDTVAGFVGAGASLKQLTLLRVRDVDYHDDALTAVSEESPAELRRRMTDEGRTFALVLDARRRPLRWVHVRDLSAATSLTSAGRPVGDSVTTQSTLQDALEAILVEGGNAVVTGAHGEYVGTIDIETVTDTIRQLRGERDAGNVAP
jgi:osmoprotectant transport system ATP-binding protein